MRIPQSPLLAHSCKHVISRSKVSISNNALWSEAGDKVRERRYPCGFTEVVVMDAVQKCLFSSRVGSFYRAIMASTGRRLGSLDTLKSLLVAIILHKTSRKDNPRHLYSHLSTHIHITKEACESKPSFAYFAFFLHATRERKSFHKREYERKCHQLNFLSFCPIFRLWFPYSWRHYTKSLTSDWCSTYSVTGKPIIMRF